MFRDVCLGSWSEFAHSDNVHAQVLLVVGCLGSSCEGMDTFRESSYTCVWRAEVTHPFGNAVRELWHVKCASAAVWWLHFCTILSRVK